MNPWNLFRSTGPALTIGVGVSQRMVFDCEWG